MLHYRDSYDVKILGAGKVNEDTRQVRDVLNGRRPAKRGVIAKVRRIWKRCLWAGHGPSECRPGSSRR